MPPGPRIVTGTLWHRVDHAFAAAFLLASTGWLVWGVEATTWSRALFWLLAPDFVFVPIAVAAARSHGAWPAWGAALYNAAHSYVTLVSTALIASLVQGHVVWPLLAWAAHIEIDRACGFDLREYRPQPA